MKDEIKEKVDMTIRKVRVAMIKHREGFYDYDMLVCHELDYNEWKNLLDYITNLQEKYDKALEDSVKETHKLMAIRKYLKDNEREYGSLEDNEKIILGIIEGE